MQDEIKPLTNLIHVGDGVDATDVQRCAVEHRHCVRTTTVI